MSEMTADPDMKDVAKYIVTDFRSPDSVVSLVLAILSTTLFVFGGIGHLLTIPLVVSRVREKTCGAETYHICRETVTVIKSASDLYGLALYCISMSARQGFGIHLPWCNTFSCMFIDGAFCSAVALSSNMSVLLATLRWFNSHKTNFFWSLPTKLNLFLVFALNAVAGGATMLLFLMYKKLVVEGVRYSFHIYKLQYCTLAKDALWNPYLNFIVVGVLVPPIVLMIFICIFSCVCGRTNNIPENENDEKEEIEKKMDGFEFEESCDRCNVDLHQTVTFAVINVIASVLIGALYIAGLNSIKTFSFQATFARIDGAMIIALLPKSLNFLLLFKNVRQRFEVIQQTLNHRVSRLTMTFPQLKKKVAALKRRSIFNLYYATAFDRFSSIGSTTYGNESRMSTVSKRKASQVGSQAGKTTPPKASYYRKYSDADSIIQEMEKNYD